MDVVYILGKGSCWQNNELRYSLRSVDKFVIDLERVFIVGECPKWLRNIIHIPAKDPYPQKWRNGYHKIITACEDPRVSEEFLLMNDDFFIIKPIRAEEYPFYHSGSLARKQPRINRKFLTTQENTSVYLKKHNRGNFNFCVHRPIRYNKKLFWAMPLPNLPARSYSPRAFYCNYYGVKSKKCRDPIIMPGRREDLINKSVAGFTDFSITTATAQQTAFRRWINKKFPKASRFEKK